MQLKLAALALLATTAKNVDGFTNPSLAPKYCGNTGSRTTSGSEKFVATMASPAVEDDTTSTKNSPRTDLASPLDVSKLPFRELQRECKARGLAAVGTTKVLRTRLIESLGGGAKQHMNGDDTPTQAGTTKIDAPAGISFADQSDPDFEFDSALSTVMEKASLGHWKAATRKLKTLQRRHATPDRPVPESAYVAVLESCASDRLHGARAAEPARKIMEELADANLDIPSELGNQCVRDCLGIEEGGKHDGCGGIDCALAMLAAMESCDGTVLDVETYGAVVGALARDGAVEEATLLTRAMVVEHSFTPPLSVFADVALAACRSPTPGHEEIVMQVLTLAKAAGYELDSIAGAEAGRSLLASGVVAAERMDNLALGLRLLTAAEKAEGCAPDAGDDLVCSSSKAAQRAATLIHRRAIDKAVAENNWKLAVRLLQLMPRRSLTPSAAVWRKVVNVCAKCEKSKKATALLLDWAKLAEEGRAEKPPLTVFNTVVNACEICGEEELTLMVLETMKKTHDTEGNIVTFNIALKRLAKKGNTRACEGIIIGMLQAGIEPSVVSYTTAIGACCTTEPKDSALAYEWLQRMRSRNVRPNLYTYNTALAACLDGRLESTQRGSKIASEMVADVDRELALGQEGTTVPDSYTKVLARNLMKQLRENWRSGDIDMAEAKATVRVPLLKLVDFDKSEEAAKAKEELKAKNEARMKKLAECTDEEDAEGCVIDELQIEYSDVSKLHKEGARVAEV